MSKDANDVGSPKTNYLKQQALRFPSHLTGPESCGNHPQAVDSLRGAVTNWPTPDASMANDSESLESWRARQQRNLAKHYNGDGMGMPLAVAARSFPSLPTEPETGRGGNTCSIAGPGCAPRSPVSTGSVLLRDSLVYQAWSLRARRATSGAPYVRPSLRKRLTPAFDAWLMGWPIWWSATGVTGCGPSAMESYLSRQRWHLSRLLSVRESRNGAMENSSVDDGD